MENITSTPAKKSRWFLGISGILSIILGFWTLLNPVISVLSMTWIFGILFIASGITSIISWFENRDKEHNSISMILNGILSASLGSILVFTHLDSLVLLAMIFAAWLIVDSCSWYTIASQTKSPTLTKIFSVIGVILASILLLSPLFSLIALLYTVSFTLIIYGFMVLVKAI